MAIVDSKGIKLAEYLYDAWGNSEVINLTIANLGDVNPFRYRGYYYDLETGLYYLNSRYYDPEVGRFISADSINYLDPKSINGLNLYAYCLNNPVMTAIPQFSINMTIYGGALMASSWDSKVNSDLKLINYNPFNANATAAARSQAISFYKGVACFNLIVKNWLRFLWV